MSQRHRRRMLKVCLNILYIVLLVLREEWLSISHSALLIFSLKLNLQPPHTPLILLGHDMKWKEMATVEWRTNSPLLLLPRLLGSLVIHSWAIVAGSYVHARVFFWLGGTKSTLYKCTLKQLPLLPTAALTQTSDCADASLAYSGGEDGYRPFTTVCLAIGHVRRSCLDIPDCKRFEKH